MDPDSGPKNTVFISCDPLGINNRIFYEENNELKTFYLGYFNSCNKALVTCKSEFTKDYELHSCLLIVSMLEKDYDEITSKDKNLSLNDLFMIEEKLSGKTKEILVYKDRIVDSLYCYEGQEAFITANWILEDALKETDIKYMDTCDKMIDYLSAKINGTKHYKSLEPFKKVEAIFQKNKTLTLNKVS